jgi:hypothetical protein
MFYHFTSVLCLNPLLKEHISAVNILHRHGHVYRESCTGARLAMCDVAWNVSELSTGTSLICSSQPTTATIQCNEQRADALTTEDHKVTGKSQCSLAMDTRPCRRWYRHWDTRKCVITGLSDCWQTSKKEHTSICQQPTVEGKISCQTPWLVMQGGGHHKFFTRT